MITLNKQVKFSNHKILLIVTDKHRSALQNKLDSFLNSERCWNTSCDNSEHYTLERQRAMFNEQLKWRSQPNVATLD